MLKQPNLKYRAFAPVRLSDRTWPDASVRRLIDDELVPAAVTIQVLTQARDESARVPGQNVAKEEIQGVHQQRSRRAKMRDLGGHSPGAQPPPDLRIDVSH